MFQIRRTIGTPQLSHFAYVHWCHCVCTYAHFDLFGTQIRDGDQLVVSLSSTRNVLFGSGTFRRVPNKRLNSVVQCNQKHTAVSVGAKGLIPVKHNMRSASIII